jgi:Putative zinc-finger
MSCQELERLFVAGAPDSQAKAHRESCAECSRVAADLERSEAIVSGLKAPEWSPNLRLALLAIPGMTVTCEQSEGLIPALIEGEIADADERRLRSHFSRCSGCSEAAETLALARGLVAPEPPAWLATRLAAVPPPPKKSFWRSAFSGKMVVAYAYAAAILVMVMGLNPTAVVRKAGFASLGESTRSAVIVAESSIGDRLGAFQEKALRTLAVWKGHVGGYGRAAVMNAIAFVWRPDAKKNQTRPPLGKEGGAASLPAEIGLAGRDGTEPFAARFRV